ASGGGSITPGILGTNGNYLFASYPGLEKDGSIAWYGQAGVYRLEYTLGPLDLGSQAAFTVYGIGLRVK
ncbi:hypothetical protein, partial [Armatimonas sp.]|uniref:hypothetical protein n=1 Tax=Armatimonas sp. TaxID=1872638 RepID=UPI00286BA944